MNDSIPTWWLTVSGIYFLLSSLFMMGLVVSVIFLVRAMSRLSERVQALTNKVEGVVDSVRKTTDAVGPKVIAVSRTAESLASNVGKRVEILASVGLAIFAIQRLRNRNQALDD